MAKTAKRKKSVVGTLLNLMNCGKAGIRVSQMVLLKITSVNYIGRLRVGDNEYLRWVDEHGNPVKFGGIFYERVKSIETEGELIITYAAVRDNTVNESECEWLMIDLGRMTPEEIHDKYGI